MHSRRLSLILSFFLALLALASPHPAAPLHPRQDPPLAGIFASVKSSTGADISSNFTTLFFDGTAIGAASNLTERQVPGLVRPINTCRHNPGDFQYSDCSYLEGVRHSLQYYRVRCRIPNPHPQPGSPSVLFVLEVGHCNNDEICVNGPEDDRGIPTIASCVGQRNFKEIYNYESRKQPGLFGILPDYNNPKERVKLEQILEGTTVNAVVSQTNRITALNVQSLELDAGIAGASKVGGAVGLTSQGKCTDCAEVATGKMAEGTDFLSTEITVSAAGAAAAGILWLAVGLSG